MGWLARLGGALEGLARRVRKDWRLTILAFIGLLFVLRLVTRW